MAFTKDRSQRGQNPPPYCLGTRMFRAKAAKALMAGTWKKSCSRRSNKKAPKGVSHEAGAGLAELVAQDVRQRTSAFGKTLPVKTSGSRAPRSRARFGSSEIAPPEEAGTDAAPLNGPTGKYAPLR